ncbi:hypothetical protein KIH74_01855 [Kineosporia sp. J2-2]|uniref:Uncharacterized protein n=1 Tax=Kineosporia corallincola TaxID=2835133 RepID=A0ABS5T9A2_9ACTN|nr:hypothetical protein [Kineosporia corallincola]MBT0767650.1 hypothetical protein [Kineosporia corallincola]
MTAPLPAGLALVATAVLAVAGYAGGWMIAAAAGLCVLALAVGWSDLLQLPDRAGTAVLVLLLGAGGLVAGAVAVSPQVDLEQPLSVFSGVMAMAVLSTFAHELVRRDGRHDLVESVTGTLSGQFVAVLAAGWVLVGNTSAGSSAVVIAAVGTAAARLALTLPLAPSVLTWVAIGTGLVSAVVASFVVGGITPVTAAAVGVSVSGVGIAVDRLVDAEGLMTGLALATLARAAAPVAAAGTAAYAIFRIGIG